ncbi:MAG: PadR family transcriptional regulator [bacterium]|nr:PadR family transcriptional regulator [bacterium]
MSVRHSLLAILADQPTHGYGLKSTFERSTAGAWPLNVGQVYTTLARLQRDGLVEPEPAASPVGDAAATVDDRDTGRQTWRITASGREALSTWFDEPIVADPPPRDELAIKVLLAVAAEHVDVTDILHRQRTATMERLQQLTHHKHKADPDRELPWLLLLDALVLKTQAELEWIERCEQRLREQRAARERRQPGSES